MWMIHEGMGWWIVFGGVLMVLFWGGIITLIIWGISRLTRRGPVANPTPLDIAKERYARGEITREQFEEIKKNL
jgi:putative membrane protein